MLGLTYLKFLNQKRTAYSKKTVIKSIHLSKDISFGKYCIFQKKTYIDRNVKIGDFVYFNSRYLEIIVDSNVEIGKFVSIGPGVIIGMGNHAINHASTHPILFNKYYINKMGIKEDIKLFNGMIDAQKHTLIGNDVWIGARSTIKRGVCIGNGAIIAGEAMVTKDVPDYAIVAGVPARVIGYRFEDKTREILINNEKKCFWNWDEEYLKSNLSSLLDFTEYVNGF